MLNKSITKLLAIYGGLKLTERVYDAFERYHDRKVRKARKEGFDEGYNDGYKTAKEYYKEKTVSQR